MTSPPSALAERLSLVRDRIARAGRSPDEVRIVAVTKGFGASQVDEAVASGVFDLGENYAQELLAKVSDAPPGVRWHFLGPVQRNKVKALAPHVEMWHGLDRAAAGAEIARSPAPAPVLVQVNITGDPRRPGVSWAGAPALVDDLSGLGLEVRGVMGVAGAGSGRDGPAEGAREQFRRLAGLAASLGLRELSMGMSDDLEVAVGEGATMVRVGTALFGARPVGDQARR